MSLIAKPCVKCGARCVVDALAGGVTYCARCVPRQANPFPYKCPKCGIIIAVRLGSAAGAKCITCDVDLVLNEVAPS